MTEYGKTNVNVSLQATCKMEIIRFITKTCLFKYIENFHHQKTENFQKKKV